ncbi:MAG: hypothetical protein JEZ07_16580 [Phycisphaerae bacterium]|nr:hypothetical protein [Phycisphaerae bacterium]
MKTIFTIMILLTSCQITVAQLDPNNFATEVTEYVQGDGITKDFISNQYFNDPTSALGRPTIDSTGDGWFVPTSQPVPLVAAFPAFRSFEIVSIGTGGHLTLKFGKKVENNPNNPFGIDLIVFGNAMLGGGGWSYNTNPENFFVSSGIYAENAIISVAQNPQGPWYDYINGPFGDSYAPTFGRVYDPENIETSLGAWNQWWAEPTDPTMPLDPAVTANTLNGKTMAQVSQLFGKSAGGTGFDLAESGFQWIQYIKIQSNGTTPEIDAVAAVDPGYCGDKNHPYPTGDINKDCIVNIEDFAILANNWLEQTWIY